MKKLLIGLNVLMLAGLAVIYYLHFEGKKTVFVESSRLLSNYKGMLAAKQQYQAKSSVWQANIDTLVNDVQKSIKNYEASSAGYSTKEKELAQELIRTKQRQLADYQKAIQDKAGQEDAKMTSQVLDEVNAYIKRYGEEHGYKIILAASEYGNIAYAEEELNITDEILEGLNKEYAGE